MSNFTENKSLLRTGHEIEMKLRDEFQKDQTQLVSAAIEGEICGDGKSALMLLGLLGGRAQMAKTMVDFSNVINLETLKTIKKTKNYKHLKGVRNAEGAVMAGTWDDFCSYIGVSRQMVDEQIKNADAFGMAALESLQAIGMGIRDLRRLRQLPPDELVTLVDGDQLKVQDREEALIIIEEMAAKHRTESNELKEKIESLEQSSKATDQLLEKKGKQIQELEKELELAKCANSPAKVKQLEAERNKILSSAVIAAKFEIFKGLAAFEDAVIAIQAVDHPCDMDDEYLSGMREIVSRMMEGSARAGLDQVVIDALKAELVMYSGALN